MKKSYVILSFAFICLVSISCNNSGNESNETGTVVQKSESSNAATSLTAIPNFIMLDETGKEVKLQDLKGKKLFVNLWASWCPPCKREMPSIEKLYQSLDKEKINFVMLGLDDQFEKSLHYIKSSKLDLPVYYPAENLPPLFNVQGIPATFIFNETGELIKRVDGMDDYDSEAYRELLK